MKMKNNFINNIKNTLKLKYQSKKIQKLQIKSRSNY